MLRFGVAGEEELGGTVFDEHDRRIIVAIGTAAEEPVSASCVCGANLGDQLGVGQLADLAGRHATVNGFGAGLGRAAPQRLQLSQDGFDLLTSPGLDDEIDRRTQGLPR